MMWQRFWHSGPHYLSEWNRRIRNAYWLIGVMIILAVLSSWPIASQAQEVSHAYIWRNVLLQNGLVLGVLLTAEWVYRSYHRLQDYAIIAIGSGIAAVNLALSTPEVSGTQVIVIMPILVAIIYFDYRKVGFACLSAMLPYMAVMVLMPSFRFDVPVAQKAVGYSLIVGATFAAYCIVNRGLAIIGREKTALMNEAKHRHQQQAIDAISRKDALTGLDNHRSFQDRLRHDVRSAQPLYLALIDIDDFKCINDRFGHLMGDAALKQVGALLRGVKDERWYAARYGGEEFAVLMRRMSEEEATAHLEALRRRVEEQAITELGSETVTVSIGCSRLGVHESRDELFRRADEALYEAKRGGKNRVVIHGTDELGLHAHNDEVTKADRQG
jgi:diguanylate cyclase (GGDEF)-like protein